MTKISILVYPYWYHLWNRRHLTGLMFPGEQETKLKMFKSHYIVHPCEMYDRFSCNAFLSSHYLFSLVRYEWTLNYCSYSKHNLNQPQYSLNQIILNIIQKIFNSFVHFTSLLTEHFDYWLWATGQNIRYSGVRYSEVCFHIIVALQFCRAFKCCSLWQVYLSVFFGLRPWWVSRVFTPRMSRYNGVFVTAGFVNTLCYNNGVLLLTRRVL